jgi:PAS domain S-box-containing protein
MLVIADRQPRPGFSDQDLQALVELAGVLAGKMELRRIAAHALESELSLREAERRFRGIADFADVLIISAGTDGHGAFVNETWLEFTGRSLEEELGDGWAEVIHPDYQRAVVEGYWQAFRERRPFAAEFSMRRHDGMYRWMQGRARPRFLDDGTFAGYIACIWDVTDYHTATMDLRKQARCTAAVAEAAGLFYLVLDSEGRIEQISPICQRTSGRQPQQMQGCLAWESCTAAQQGAAAVRDAVRQAASSGATVRAPTTYASPSRGEVGLLWTITPIQSERGEASTLVATVFEPGGRDRLAANGESGCACSH